MQKKKNVGISFAMVLATLFVFVGGTYVYFPVFFKDERTSNDGTTNLNTDFLSNIILVSDVKEGSVAFLNFDIFVK